MSCAWMEQNCRIGLIIGTGTNACYLEDIQSVHTLEEMPGVNFTNIFRAIFLTKAFCASSNYSLALEFYWQKTIGIKAACKVLVKFTTCLQTHKPFLNHSSFLSLSHTQGCLRKLGPLGALCKTKTRGFQSEI